MPRVMVRDISVEEIKEDESPMNLLELKNMKKPSETGFTQLLNMYKIGVKNLDFMSFHSISTFQRYRVIH